MSAKLIKGKEIAAEIRAEIKVEVDKLKAEKGVTPGFGDDIGGRESGLIETPS